MKNTNRTIVLNIKSGKKSAHSLKGAQTMVKYNPKTFVIIEGDALPIIELKSGKMLWYPEATAKLMQAQKPDTYLIPTNEGIQASNNSEREISIESEKVIEQPKNDLVTTTELVNEYQDQEQDVEIQKTIDATEKAIELAEENNIDLSSILGTGKDGKVTTKDVKAYIKE